MNVFGAVLVVVMMVMVPWCGYQAEAAASYDLTMAQTMILYSKAAYCDPADLVDWDCDVCSDPLVSGFSVHSILTNASTDTHGFVGVSVSDGLIVVSYRGTQVAACRCM